MVTWCDHYNARKIGQFCMFIQSQLHLKSSQGLASSLHKCWVIWNLHERLDTVSRSNLWITPTKCDGIILGKWHCFTKNRERFAKSSEETHCEGVVSLQGVFRWFLFWARRRKTQEKWLSDAPSHFSPVASLLLQHNASIVAKTFKYKYSNNVQVYCDYFYKIAVVYNTFLEIA